MSNIQQIHSAIPQPELITKAAHVIKTGGVIAFPTRCLYGLGVDAFNSDAVEKVFRIKQRPLNKPILVLIKKRDLLDQLVTSIPPVAVRIMDRFWPGKVTIIFKAKDILSPRLTAGTGKIGIRIPEHPVAAAIVNTVKNPITGTSANLSGSAGCSRISNLNSFIAEKLDLILNAGLLKGGKGSTVVDISTDPPKILREGEISSKEIFS